VDFIYREKKRKVGIKNSAPVEHQQVLSRVKFLRVGSLSLIDRKLLAKLAAQAGVKGVRGRSASAVSKLGACGTGSVIFMETPFPARPALCFHQMSCSVLAGISILSMHATSE